MKQISLIDIYTKKRSRKLKHILNLIKDNFYCRDTGLRGPLGYLRGPPFENHCHNL